LKGKTVGENPYCGINIYIKKRKEYKLGLETVQTERKREGIE